MMDGFVGHSEIVGFCDDRVNLKRDDVSEYREQVNRLRKKLTDYIAAHPGFDLVKMLHSGSVSKRHGAEDHRGHGRCCLCKKREGAGGRGKAIAMDSGSHPRSLWRHAELGADRSSRRHCITVSFKGTGLDVDVVPVRYEGDPEDRGYLIPPSTGKRVLTSITLHLKFTRKRKKDHAVHYRQMVRLVKWWARIQRRVSETGSASRAS